MITKALFLDIGGVLLTDGWPHSARKQAAAHFKYNFAEVEERHKLMFPTFELGRVTLRQYFDFVIFFQKRSFTRNQIWQFMIDQSSAFPNMIKLMADLKARYDLKIFVVSNEARELNAYRIKNFKLNQLADVFISSCYVQVSKPDPAIFRMALDVAQLDPKEVIYIDDRALFIDVAARMGITGIHHVRHKLTQAALAKIGLS